MVDSIGPNKIKSITKSKPVVRGKMDKPRGEENHPKKDSSRRTGEKNRLGVNIDERC